MNNNRIAEFKKVSFSQFLNNWMDVYKSETDECIEEMIHDIYDKIDLPVRATVGSAGYDFMCPCDIELKPGESIKVPTGIRCRMDNGWVLMLYPRSSLGFKYRMQLDNTVGIIDGDYFSASNEGHIIAKIHNDSNSGNVIKIKRGDRFIQGIFMPYGITVNDNVDGVRNGGFGSTGRW